MPHPFVQSLVNALESHSFAGLYTHERDLEREVYEITRQTFGDFVPGRDVEAAVVTHGETPERKKRWTDTKTWQDVPVYGCKNTGDVVVKHRHIGTVSVQVKLAKGSIAGPLQTLIGQLFIGSLRHDAVVGVLLSVRPVPPLDGYTAKLLRRLREAHSAFLVVRQVADR